MMAHSEKVSTNQIHLTLRNARYLNYADARVGLTDPIMLYRDLPVQDTHARLLRPQKTLTVKRFLQRAFGVCPTVYNGKHCGLC